MVSLSLSMPPLSENERGIHHSKMHKRFIKTQKPNTRKKMQHSSSTSSSTTFLLLDPLNLKKTYFSLPLTVNLIKLKNRLTLPLFTTTCTKTSLIPIQHPKMEQQHQQQPIEPTTTTITTTTTTAATTTTTEDEQQQQTIEPTTTTTTTTTTTKEEEQQQHIEPTTTTAATTTTEEEQQPSQTLSKNAQKRLKKQQRYEVKKAEKKAYEKEQKKIQKERKQREWAEKLASLGSEEEKLKLIESRKGMRKERMDKRNEERGKKIERLGWAKLHGQNIVIDLEFSHLMTDNELHSLVQQIMYCYAVNGRCNFPGHLWLTGCEGNMESQMKRVPGFDKWIIEKESRSYIEALQDQKEKLVYLTADAETVLDDLDVEKTYIIGGLVDRNRWKGITMKKAQEQGIQTARLPIGNYLKMSSSQVLTVNQVVEILLKYLELRDWKASFFQVIPLRKRCESEPGEDRKGAEEESKDTDESSDSQKKLKMSEIDSEASDKDGEHCVTESHDSPGTEICNSDV